ncbi:MAG: UvrD-helicase domain-containing protein [Planctomycetota bacterium]|nr:UvrD-helicase domain-containing protein [Planctomycetota bacterium]
MQAATDLNPAQNEAVEHRDGPMLVLAGPGSGKTRVITRRIARLIQTGVYPSRILALTFTNKAANEMAARVESLLPGTRVWVSTFHRYCAKILRRFGPAVGLKPNFSILDMSDQGAVMREVLSEQNIDATHFSPGKMLGRISKAKQRLQTADEFAKQIEEGHGSYFDQVAARVYQNYQELLLRSNAVDFDDLLAHVGRLLLENEEIREELGEKFRYVLVDEYQDTNFAQYQIVRTLASGHRNLCVTGDPDQSIYGWRGAEIGNILQFEKDFPEARVVRLEQNYRSTQVICRAADALIANNQRRKAKTLYTENEEGPPIESLFFDDQHLEAEGVATLIRQLSKTENRAWSEFAIFFRVNALSRAIELALGRHRIPYQVAAGLAFYERAEVKDLLAYLRLISNPADRTAFQRVVNTPLRGIGKSTVSKLIDWADQQRITPLEAARDAGRFPGLTKRAVTALAKFADIIDRLVNTPFGGVTPLFDELLKSTGYGSGWDKGDETELQKSANISELRTAAAQYDTANASDPTLEGFLENSSLVADLDGVDETAGKVTLMTLHAAKGLEFPVVFVAAVEEGILPHERSLRSEVPGEVEEERRLMFVGATRARERLYLTRTWMREMRGQHVLSTPSRFLEEMALDQRGSKGKNKGATLARTSVPRASAQPADPFPGPAKFARRDVASTIVESPRSPTVTAPVVTAGVAEETASAAKLKRAAKLSGIPHLTTGASLLAGTSEPVEIPRLFSVGMSVRHPQLGLGKVIQASGEGKMQTVMVAFSNGDERSFVTHKAPLQPVGLR